MIRYENISRADMEAYWGNGHVLVPHYSKRRLWYNAYISKISNKQIELEITYQLGKYGDPPRELTWSYEEFFRNAILHRPHLGVVVVDGFVYALGWKHANGMHQLKALTSKDIYVEVVRRPPVPKPKKRGGYLELFVATNQQRLEYLLQPAVQDNMPGNLWDDLPVRNRVYAEQMRDHPNSPLSRNIQKEPIPDSMSLALRYLNQESHALREVMDAARDGVYHLHDTVWAQYSDSTCYIMNGEWEVGQIRALYPNHVEYQQPTRVRTLAAQTICARVLNQEKSDV